MSFPVDLPNLRGRLKARQPLSAVTWFQVGGPSDWFFKPADQDDLAYFMQHKPHNMPIHILGAGSNVLVHDEGVDGCVIKLGSSFADVKVDGDVLIAGAGALDRTVAMMAKDHGLSNLEFLVGIPGTIGGAVAMNAGAYAGEIKDFILWADVMDTAGNITRMHRDDFKMSYRKGNLPKGSIVLQAAFTMVYKKSEDIAQTLSSYLEAREQSQPVRGRTGGSTFKNPSEYAAWKLIDEAGCRGMTIGDAQVSEKHCNFLLNLGTATSNDIEQLGEQVRQRVLEKSGVALEWEIIRLGRAA